MRGGGVAAAAAHCQWCPSCSERLGGALVSSDLITGIIAALPSWCAAMPAASTSASRIETNMPTVMTTESKK